MRSYSRFFKQLHKKKTENAKMNKEMTTMTTIKMIKAVSTGCEERFHVGCSIDCNDCVTLCACAVHSTHCAAAMCMPCALTGGSVMM